MALKLVIGSQIEPVSLAEAKEHLRLEQDYLEEDNFINAIITVAREYCEDFQGRSYCQQTWELWLDNFPKKDYFTIPRPPLQSVNYIKYFGSDNTEHEFIPNDYFVDDKSEPGRIVLAYNKTWPTTTLRSANAVVCQFVAGYTPGGTEQEPDYAVNVPQKVKQAMLLLISYWYDNREAAVSGTVSREVQFSVNALLWQDRIIPV